MAASSGRLCALQAVEILHKIENIWNLQEPATSRQSGVIFVNISTSSIYLGKALALQARDRKTEVVLNPKDGISADFTAGGLTYSWLAVCR